MIHWKAQPSIAGGEMTIRKIIELCGGEGEIAYRLGFVNIYVVRRWETHGVPLKYWPRLIALANERGNRLTGDSLWRANEPIINALQDD